MSKITENTHRTFKLPSIFSSHPVQPKTSFSKPFQSDMSYGKRFALLSIPSVETKPTKTHQKHRKTKTDHSAKKSQTKELPAQKQSPKLDVFNTVLAPLMRTLPTSLPRELPELCTNLPLVLHESEYQAERQAQQPQVQTPPAQAKEPSLHGYSLSAWNLDPVVESQLKATESSYLHDPLLSLNHPIVLHESEYQAARQAAAQRQINSAIKKSEKQSAIIESTPVRTSVPHAQEPATYVPAPLVSIPSEEQQRPEAATEPTIVITEAPANQERTESLPATAAKTQSLWDKFWGALNSIDTTHMDAPMYLY